MARAKTTDDVFSAIGEPKRREFIDRLALKKMTENDLAEATQWPQPMVSKSAFSMFDFIPLLLVFPYLLH